MSHKKISGRSGKKSRGMPDKMSHKKHRQSGGSPVNIRVKMAMARFWNNVGKTRYPRPTMFDSLRDLWGSRK